MRFHSRRGAALILVVVVIAALLAIAAPFVVSMRLHEKSSRAFSAQVRAKQVADGARNQAVAHLMTSHEDEERRAREAAGTQAGDEEGQDTHDEVQRFDLTSPRGLSAFEVTSPTGTMAQVTIRDARARLDLNTSGSLALANLLGATVTTAPTSYREKKRLWVEDVGPFLHTSDGDPTTIDGFIRVNGEYIAYRHIDPSRNTFEGLVRGYLFSRAEEPEEEEVRRRYLPEGSLVQDGRGHKLAYDPLWRYMDTDRQGLLARFDNTGGVRRIADWEFGTLRAALVLFRNGVNMKLLRQWGVVSKDLLGAGLEPDEFDVENKERPKESAAEKRERLEIERTLKRWGVPLDFARRFGGDRAVKRIYERLAAMEPDRRKKQIEGYKKRESKLGERLKTRTKWLKAETKLQLTGLTEARNHAPHLETIGRIELEERVRPYVTTDAPPEGEAWSDPQAVNHIVQFRPYSFGQRLQIQDTRRYRRGWIVRIQPRRLKPEDAPRLPEYRMCVSVNREAVVIFPQLDFDYEQSEVTLSCRQPRSVNLNTASREVLMAVMTGLRSRTGQKQRARGGQAPNFVRPNEAQAVADAIVAAEGGLQTPLDLRNILVELRQTDAIDDHDVDAIYRNSIDPSDPMLPMGTVPFCYRTGDVYELSVTGIVNDPAGNELARHSFREVVQVAPPRELIWQIDSQADFTDRVYVTGRTYRVRDRRRMPFQGSLPWLSLAGRWSNLVGTRPVQIGPFQTGPYRWPSRSHAPGEGDLRALFAREPDQATPGNTSEPTWANLGTSGPAKGPLAPHNPNRWDDSVDGADLSSISLDRNTLATRWYRTEIGTGRATVGPGLIRGWFRFDSVPAAGVKAFLFDGGQGDTLDRISLFLEGPDRMVLEVHDEALDLIESGGSPRGVRLIYDRPLNLPFRQGNWYHVAAFFKGGDRGDLALAVDGVFVGQETHGSRLSAGMDRYQNTLTVEDPSGFPPSGWVRVGGSRFIASPNAADRGIWGTGFDASERCEVLRYTAINGNTLQLADSADTWAANPPANQTLRSAIDLNDFSGNNSLGQLPTRARVPLRGSGHRIRLNIDITLPNGQTRRSIGFTFMGYPHEVGAQVVPFGYGAWLKNESTTGPPIQIPGLPGITPNGYQETLRVGGATLRQPLARNTPFTLAYKEMQYNAQDPRPIVIQPAETEIPTFWLEAFATEQPRPVPTDPNNPPMLLIRGGFPPFGILRVGTERVFYSGIDLARGVFTNCIRGIEGTVAAAHRMWTPIVLESIQTTDMSDYPTRAAFTDPRVHVSLTQGQARAGQRNTEWLSILNVADPALRARGLVLIPPREDFNALAQFYLQSRLQDMRARRNGALPMPRGFAPGNNPGLLVPPTPIPNPPIPGWQVPWYDNVPFKEVLKRVEPSGVRTATIRIGNRTVQLPFQIGSRRAKATSPPPDPLRGHVSGTKIVPTFVLRLEDGNYNHIVGRYPANSACEAGVGDVVTVMDESGAAPEREERRVAHAAFSAGIPTQVNNIAQQAGITLPSGDIALGWLVAFDDFVSRPYLGSANARLARWPVGNLRDQPTALVFGRARDPSGPNDTVGDAPGTLTGRIDDFVSHQLDENPGGMLVTNLPASLGAGDVSAAGMAVNANTWKRGRLLRSDGEVLAVIDASRTRGGSDVTFKRGALTTTAAPVSRETALWRMIWPPMAVASGGFSSFGNSSVSAQRPDAESRFRQNVDGGYLRVDSTGGILPYMRLRNGRNARFERPIDRYRRGAYLSAFGSSVRGVPVANDVLTDLPFRHHDRYAPRVDSLEGLYFQTSRELPGGYLERVTWDATLPDNHCRVIVAVRADGVPSWSSQPVARDRSGVRGGLYVFNDPGQPNRIRIPATRVEVRVYVTYLPRSYEEDAWKQGAVVGRVRVHYRQATRSLRREERTD
jgi:hypothetical protein